MKTKRWAVVVCLAAWAMAAFAQVPAHAPGTICFTQKFWCWAQPPGPPGSSCACPTQWGWVQGIRG